MHTTEAIVLKSRAINEADELVSFYTKNFGKMRIKAKASKKITTKQGNFLHSRSVVKCSFVVARRGYILSGLRETQSYPRITEDFRTSGYVDSFFTLCDKVLYEGQRDDALWNLFNLVLKDAERAAADSAKNSLLWRSEKIWLIRLLDALGFRTDLQINGKIKESRDLDIYMQKLLQSHLEIPIEFFGLKRTKHI